VTAADNATRHGSQIGFAELGAEENLSPMKAFGHLAVCIACPLGINTAMSATDRCG
jgi:hypothetical protein